jgi:cytochrome b
MKTNDIIWDIQTRVYHWLIAIPVFLNLVLEDGDSLHKVLGYLALFGLFLRGIWGFRSKSRAARPRNPVASWIYIGIWTNVALLGLSGFMMGLDAFWGEEWPEKIHETLALIMKIQVLIHFAGIVFDSIKFKRKTWLGMIVGKR